MYYYLLSVFILLFVCTRNIVENFFQFTMFAWHISILNRPGRWYKYLRHKNQNNKDAALSTGWKKFYQPEFL